MLQTMLNLLTPAQGIGYLQPSTLSQGSVQLANEEKALESLLRDKVASLRLNDEHVGTSFDS
jgi:hypothetical protein